MRVRRVSGAGTCGHERQKNENSAAVTSVSGVSCNCQQAAGLEGSRSKRLLYRANKRSIFRSVTCQRLRGGGAPMVTSVWPLPRPGKVDRKGFCPTWLDLRLPFGVPPSVFCTPAGQACQVRDARSDFERQVRSEHTDLLSQHRSGINDHRLAGRRDGVHSGLAERRAWKKWIFDGCARHGQQTPAMSAVTSRTVALAKLKTNPVMLLCTRCAASVSSGWKAAGVNLNGCALTAVQASSPSRPRATYDLRARRPSRVDAGTRGHLVMCGIGRRVGRPTAVLISVWHLEHGDVARAPDH